MVPKRYGTRERGATGPDGKVMHAELKIGNSRIFVNDPVMDNKGPKAYGGSPASLWLYVEDCDALFKRAVTAGAQVAHAGRQSVLGRSDGRVRRPARIQLVGRHTEGKI